jgi:2-dehydro-3-deoxyphosphogluconate aldolase/(4S)-4-hydroxy-2-oxoglutarate aldolase
MTSTLTLPRIQTPRAPQKFRVLSTILESGIIAIIRATTADQAARIADACAEGGINAIEVTFTVPGAAAVIEDVARRYESSEIMIGAGTVLDPETARVAILGGAKFLVAPSLNTDTARLCNRYQIPYMPGAGSIAEIVASMECGADLIKVFPGETLGPGFVKAALAPLPQAPLVPTGGVALDNVAAWIKAGALAVGVGGTLSAGAKTGDYGSITALARQFVTRIEEARQL